MSRPSKRPPAARPPQQQYPPTAYIHSYEASLTYPESGSQTETGGLIKYAGEVQDGCEVWADRWVLLVFLKGWSVYFDIYCVQIDNGGTALYTTALDIVSSLDPFDICRPWRMYISICRPSADHLFYGPFSMIHLLTSLSLSLSLARHDIIHLLPSLPNPSSLVPPPSPTLSSTSSSSSSSWSLPSEIEETWYLSDPEEIEAYKSEKKKKWIEALRQERLREREREDLEAVKVEKAGHTDGRWDPDEEVRKLRRQNDLIQIKRPHMV